jgi:glycosyltransferase involved in cell wall biosynthesis
MLVPVYFFCRFNWENRVTRAGIHVLHMTEAPLGGVLSYIQEIVSAQLRDDEIRHITLFVSQVNVPELSHFAGPKLTLESFPGEDRSPVGLGRLVTAARRIIKQTNPDIVHAHSTWAGFAVRTAMLAAPRRPKIVYCPHSWAFTRESGRVMNASVAAMERLLSRVTDRIVCVSNAEKRQGVEAGIRADKMQVIENGIKDDGAVPSTRPSHNKEKTVLFVGRFDHQKGFDVYLNVLRELKGEAVGIAVGDYLVGSGDHVEPPDNITLMGWRKRDEVRPLFAEADLMLMPSRWEGLPIVALEAMRDGLPLFATNVGGLEDVVADGVTGHLLTSHDPKDIASRIRATDIQTLREYGRNARARFVDRFTADRMNEKLIALYVSLCGKAPHLRQAVDVAGR